MRVSTILRLSLGDTLPSRRSRFEIRPSTSDWTKRAISLLLFPAWIEIFLEFSRWSFWKLIPVSSHVSARNYRQNCTKVCTQSPGRQAQYFEPERFSMPELIVEKNINKIFRCIHLRVNSQKSRNQWFQRPEL